MKILAIGDVVGSEGCQFLRDKLPALKKTYQVDLVIANGENSADGNGVTPASADYLFSSGVDVLTGGNHSFRRKESYAYYDRTPYLLRPANYPSENTPGQGVTVYDFGRCQVGVISLLGTLFLEDLDNPFRVVDRLLKDLGTRLTVVDFHAEATAEKRAMGFYLDGRVTALFGTHTHVQTADEEILPKGTGYITDVGMTGPEQSVLGVVPEIAVKKFRDCLPVRFETAPGPCRLEGVLFEADEKTGRTLSVKRLKIR